MKPPSFAIAVTFHIKPECVQQFRARILQQASDSLERESGCCQFDVLVDETDGTQGHRSFRRLRPHGCGLGRFEASKKINAPRGREPESGEQPESGESIVLTPHRFSVKADCVRRCMPLESQRFHPILLFDRRLQVCGAY
jgi:hypothetical protein